MGYIDPINKETGELVLSQSRIETLYLYHGVKSKASRNTFLASFPPQLIGQLVNLKHLTITSFIDDEVYSKQLV